MLKKGSRPRLNLRPNGVAKSTRQGRMQRAMEAGPKDGALKVRLDRRTVITLSGTDKLPFWKERYPNLQVLP